MKNFFKLLLFSSFFTNCAPSSYYQLFETKSNSSDITKDLKYEDEICIISYDFWSDKGSSGFSIYNKSDKNIFIDKNKCFFIKNKIAYDYFRNRTFSYSESVGASNMATKAVTGINKYGYIQQNKIGAGISTSKGESVTYIEKEVVCIPPKTIKLFYEYSISNLPFRHCDIKKYPNKKDNSSVSFNYSDSPVKFGNIIVYSLDGNNTENFINNEFYISRITNYPSTTFKTSVNGINCDNPDSYTTNYVKVFNFKSKDKFYIKYSGTNSGWNTSILTEKKSSENKVAPKDNSFYKEYGEKPSLKVEDVKVGDVLYFNSNFSSSKIKCEVTQIISLEKFEVEYQDGVNGRKKKRKISSKYVLYLNNEGKYTYLKR